MGFNPRVVARAGRKVYERHRADFERLHQGKYVLIDIRTEKVYLAESPEDAYLQAAAEGAFSSPSKWRRYAALSIATTPQS
jgi:hypothetical protein